jgi:hypothetical protein
MTTGPRITVDFVTRVATSPASILAPVAGDLMLFVSFTGITAGVQGSLSPTLTALSLVLKGVSQGEVLAVSSGFQLVVGSTPSQYVIHVPLAGTALEAALLDNDTPSGSAVSLLAEIAWTMANPFVANFGPATISTRSLTFPLIYSTAAYGTTALAVGAGAGGSPGGEGSTPGAAISPLGQALIGSGSAADATQILGLGTPKPFGVSLLSCATAAEARGLLYPVNPIKGVNLQSQLVGYWSFRGTNPISYPADNGGVNASGGGVLTFQTGNTGSGQITAGEVAPGMNGLNAFSVPHGGGRGLFIPQGNLPAVTVFTVTCWVKLNVAGAAPLLACVSNNVSELAECFFLSLNASNQAVLAVYTSIAAVPGIDFGDGAWHFISIQVAANGSIVTVDNDGYAVVAGVPGALNARPFAIARNTHQNVGIGGFSICNLGIWSRKLSGQEISALYANGVGLAWPF